MQEKASHFQHVCFHLKILVSNYLPTSKIVDLCDLPKTKVGWVWETGLVFNLVTSLGLCFVLLTWFLLPFAQQHLCRLLCRNTSTSLAQRALPELLAVLGDTSHSHHELDLQSIPPKKESVYMRWALIQNCLHGKKHTDWSRLETRSNPRKNLSGTPPMEEFIKSLNLLRHLTKKSSRKGLKNMLLYIFWIFSLVQACQRLYQWENSK